MNSTTTNLLPTVLLSLTAVLGALTAVLIAVGTVGPAAYTCLGLAALCALGGGIAIGLNRSKRTPR
ncbi:hypothetical protein [Actinomyces radicidentis]|uniref:Uncharacterized protein n=1 Tax=Actinomyces radicidentis TaxID=111015 RepID=A0A0X8JDN1_ACTRD|nr:hypothetical protein [Actinomyces radicidentis]AMD86964.1 hypothetical protein AXF14_04325 [Actinomyces radicidentis]